MYKNDPTVTISNLFKLYPNDERWRLEHVLASLPPKPFDELAHSIAHDTWLILNERKRFEELSNAMSKV